MSDSTRSTEAEKNIRIMNVAKAILSGYTKRSFLIQYLSEKFKWGVTDRCIDGYVREAKDLIRNQYSEDDLTMEKDIAINRLESLFTMNMKIQDYRECRNVTIDRMKLLGLYTDRNEINIKTEQPLFPEE